MKLRITYSKKDTVKYVSHLDTLRIFERAIRRAALPIKYTQGFNQHPIMTFALPLGVGISSENDYMEIDLTESIPENIVIEKLNNVLPVGFEIKNAMYSDDKKSLMSQVNKAKYIINVFEKLEFKQIEGLFNEKDLTVKKENKEINISEKLHKFYIKKIENYFQIEILADAGSSSNLRPDLILELINDRLNLKIENYNIIRKELILI